MCYSNSNKSSDQFTAKPEKYPQKRFNPKPCKLCGSVFNPLAPSHLYCSDECKDQGYSVRYLNRSYGLSLEEYQALHSSQKGVCYICQKEGFKMQEHHTSTLVVDHCHSTGTVRGLLCHNCNRALGLLQDNVPSLRRAIEYLEGATTIPQGSTPKQVEAHSPDTVG